VDQPDPATYDAIVLAVAHDAFKAIGAEQIHALSKTPHVLYDLKYLLPADVADLRL
jgi:UDP-N-acetyl-D-galactosamine dehydrogenase